MVSGIQFWMVIEFMVQLALNEYYVRFRFFYTHMNWRLFATGHRHIHVSVHVVMNVFTIVDVDRVWHMGQLSMISFVCGYFFLTQKMSIIHSDRKGNASSVPIANSNHNRLHENLFLLGLCVDLKSAIWIES